MDPRYLISIPLLFFRAYQPPSLHSSLTGIISRRFVMNLEAEIFMNLLWRERQSQSRNGNNVRMHRL